MRLNEAKMRLKWDPLHRQNYRTAERLSGNSTGAGMGT